MNVLFLTLGRIDSIDSHSIYCDLLREFYRNGHSVYILSPGEEQSITKTATSNEAIVAHIRINTVRGGKDIIKKGISVLQTGDKFIKGIKEHYHDIKFDLVLYSTPPITFVSAVEYIKKRDGATSYLLLKDIFPQNAIDIGILKTTGINRILAVFFRRIEKKLYKVSDYIGCMSKANVKYITSNNPSIPPERVEVCPNSIEVIDKSIEGERRVSARKKYGIPINKTVFVYGGNLGKPQDIPFVIRCIRASINIDDAYFIIIGSGSEYDVIRNYVETEKPSNIRLLQRMEKDEYDEFVGACDVGLIFLDHRFTIPNFPSRILSYMQAKLPIVACTDTCSDIGDEIVNGGFGWWCESNDVESFTNTIKDVLSSDLKPYKENAFSYLNEHYSVQNSYRIIMSRITQRTA